MKSHQDIQKIVKEFKVKPRSEMRGKVLDDAMKIQQDQRAHADSGQIWRSIMHSKITKLAVAAVLMIVIGVYLQMPSGIVSTAYALQDTLKAYRSIRWVRVCEHGIDNSETWTGFDEQGQVERMRYQTDAIGGLVIAGTSGDYEAWVAYFKVHLVGYGFPSFLLKYDISELNPTILFERLYEQESKGDAIVDIHEPVDKKQSIVVTVTYPAHHRSKDWKKIFYIDPATDLITRIEKFKRNNQNDELVKTLEFMDYNKVINPVMFALDNEVDSAAVKVDMSEVAVGLPQGNMTGQEVATQVIRSFFEAIIAQDFDRAGPLFLAAPGFIFQQSFGNFKAIKIMSMGEVQPATDPDSDTMEGSCKVLLENQGQYYEADYTLLRVAPIGENKDRWMITGFAQSLNLASGEMTLSKEDVSLDGATYDGLVPGEFMKKWLVLDPIQIKVRGDTLFPSEETQKIAFNTDHINVKSFEPQVTIDEKSYEWSVLECEYGPVDLTKINNNWYHITYAWAQIDMPEETKGVLGIGSDDSVKVWLNGELVHENWTCRGVGIDNDRVPVTFKKGMNQLVLKIQNGGGSWGFCCRLMEE